MDVPLHAKASETGGNMLSIDDIELEAQGYSREMPRQFSFWSLFSFSYTILATWIGFGASLGLALNDASFAGAIWALPIAGVITAIFTLGMAELASGFGVAGAQYYWSYVVAPAEWAPFASYFAGCFGSMAWVLGLTSITNYLASVILGLVVLNHETYTIERWHVWIVATILTWICIAFNVFAARLLPLYNKFTWKAPNARHVTHKLTIVTVYLSLLTLLVSIVTLLACKQPDFQNARIVFADTTNSTRWPSNGLAFLLAILNSLYGYMGVDGPAHLSEEIPDPIKNVPKIMLFSVLIGFISSFLFAIVIGFVITDLEVVLATPTGFPLIEVYYQATRSKAATTILISLFIYLGLGAAVGAITVASRYIWAGARDDCYPCSSLLSQVHPRWKMPVNAAVFMGGFVSIYGLIFLGSATAFNSIVGSAIAFLVTTYAIPQAVLALRSRKDVLPPHSLDLGRWGRGVNILSCLLVLCVDVLFCLPSVYPVTRDNMNWTSVLLVGFCPLIVVNWIFHQRHVFHGPNVDLQLLTQTRDGGFRVDNVRENRDGPKVE